MQSESTPNSSQPSQVQQMEAMHEPGNDVDGFIKRMEMEQVSITPRPLSCLHRYAKVDVLQALLN